MPDGIEQSETNMKKSFYLIVILALTSILFSGCKKWFDEPDSKEDLSYLIKTYYRYESNNHIYKYTWTYDGYKETGYKYYYDGQLYEERNNYSYNGLNASYDSYTYRDSITNYQQVECEYLDDTYRRVKYKKTQYYYPDHPQDNYIYETYYEYEGKKVLGYKSYRNGILAGESHYDYNGLRCTYKTTSYYSSSNTISQEQSYDIAYLDDSYLRTKSSLRTRKRYDPDGNLTSSDTYYYVYDYNGKKPVGYQYYYDGELRAMGRDYQYDGLNCFYFIDNYRDGEVF